MLDASSSGALPGTSTAAAQPPRRRTSRHRRFAVCGHAQQTAVDNGDDAGQHVEPVPGGRPTPDGGRTRTTATVRRTGWTGIGRARRATGTAAARHCHPRLDRAQHLFTAGRVPRDVLPRSRGIHIGFVQQTPSTVCTIHCLKVGTLFAVRETRPTPISGLGKIAR